MRRKQWTCTHVALPRTAQALLSTTDTRVMTSLEVIFTIQQQQQLLSVFA